jgi:hypothetical protein
MEPYVLIEKHYVPVHMYREMMNLPPIPNVINSTQLTYALNGQNHQFNNLMNYSPVDFSYFVRDTPSTIFNRPIIPQTLSRPEIVETSNISTNINPTIINTSNTNGRLTNNILDTIINSITSVLPNNRTGNIQGVIISNVPLERSTRTHRVINQDDDDHGFNPNVINQHTNFYKYEDFTKLDTFDIQNTNFTSCSICQNNFENNEIVRQFKNCKHVFHLTCVDTWLTNRSTCPTCRQPLINNHSDTEEDDEGDDEDDEEDDEDEDEDDNDDPDYNPEEDEDNDNDNNDNENTENNNIPQPTQPTQPTPLQSNTELFNNIINLYQQYLSNSNSNVVQHQVTNLISQLFPQASPFISSVDTFVNTLTRNH